MTTYVAAASWLAATAEQGTSSTWVDAILALLNVTQTLALAVMAGRSRRQRRDDKRPRTRDELVDELLRRRR